jgi:hypothetical protein
MRRISIPALCTLGIVGGLLLLPLLTACGGGERQCQNHVSVASFGLCLGNDWERVGNDTLRERGIPEETKAAFRRLSQREGQRDNIVISEESLPASVPSLSYAEANVRSVTSLSEYSTRETREVKVDGNKTLLHIFTARPVPDLPARRFYQLSLTRSTQGYTFTGTLPFSPDDGVEKELLEILMSVTLE